MRALFCCLAVTAVRLCAADEGQFQIQNFGFEDAVDETVFSHIRRIERIDQEAYAGSYCLRVYVEEEAPWDKNLLRGSLEIKKMHPLSGGTKLRFQFCVRANDITQIIPIIRFFRDKNEIRDKRVEKHVTAAGISGWKRMTFDVTAPDDAEEVNFMIFGWAVNRPDANASFDLDEIYIGTADSLSSPDGSKGAHTLFPERLTLYAPKSDARIRTDGDMSEQAWAALPWNENFIHYKTAQTAKHATRFKVVNAKEGLHFAIEAHGGKTVAKSQTRDSGLFDDDVVEIFITPSFGNSGYRQLAFNRLGTQFDCMLISDQRVPGQWDPEWRIAARETDDGYIAEVFIPNETAGIDAGSTVLGLNVCRESRIESGEREISSWAGLKNSFSRYWDYGQLILGARGESPAIQWISMQSNMMALSITSGVALRGWLTYRADHEGSKIGYAQQEFTLPGTGIYSFPVPKVRGGEQYCTVVGKNNDGTTAATTVKFSVEPPPMLMTLTYAGPEIIPACKESRWKNERFDLNGAMLIEYYPSPNGYEEKTAIKVRDYLAPQASIREGSGIAPQPGTIVVGSLRNERFIRALSSYQATLTRLRAMKTKKEGYILELLPRSTAILAGQDGSGAYYAFRTMLQVKRFDPHRMPQGQVVDWPDHERRGYHLLVMGSINLKAATFREADALKKLLFENVSGFKFNSLIFDPLHQIALESAVPLRYNRPDSQLYSPRMLKEAFEYARENFIEVIPLVQSPGHGNWLLRAYPELKEYPNAKNKEMQSDIICTSNPKTYDVLFPMMSELYDIYGKPGTFHIGHDEVRIDHSGGEDIFSCPYCKNTPRKELFLRDIVKQTAFLKGIGVSNIIMWADMLIPERNGGPRYGDCAAIRNDIPGNSVIPMHWIAGSAPRKGEDACLSDSQFPRVIWSHNTLDCTSVLPDNPERYFAFYVNMWGNLMPWLVEEMEYDWQFLRACHGADTFWNIKTKQSTYIDFEHAKGTALMRITSARNVSDSTVFTRIELPGRSDDLSAWDLPAKTGFDFRSISGIQQSRYRELLNDGKAVLLRDGRDEIAIPVGRRARVIAAVHTMHLAPAKAAEFAKKNDYITRTKNRYGYEVGRYVIKYADGSVFEAPVSLGYNIFNWNTSDTTRVLYDASEIWNIPLYPQPLTAAVFVLEHPNPEKEIREIVFRRIENTIELGLFALAAGD